MKATRQILSTLLACTTLTMAACGNKSDSSSDGSGDEAKEGNGGESRGEAKGRDAGGAKAAAKAPQFQTYGDGEAPIEISGLTAKADKHFIGNGNTKNLESTYKVKLVKAVEDGTMVTIKSTCKIGAEFLSETTSPLIQLEKLQPGETKNAESLLYGMNGFVGDPETCEISFFVSKLISTDPPHHLTDFCWTGSKVKPGACDGFARPATDGTPIKMTKASAAYEKIEFGDSKGRIDLKHECTVRVGTAIDSGKSIFVKTACYVGDEKIVDEAPVMAIFTYTMPGESLNVSGSSYPMRGVASEPSHCDVSFSLKGLLDGDGETFANYCFKGGNLAEGKC